MSALTQRFDGICERIGRALERAGRSGGSLRLVAVSKWHGAAALAELARYWAERHDEVGEVGELGARASTPLFGESYVQEAAEKMPAVAALLSGLAVEWHFVGHVQSRKSRDVAGSFSLIHSVDSLKLAAALDRAVREDTRPRALHEPAPGPQAVLVQVNVGREAQKSGVFPEKLEELLNAMASMPGIRVEGLMCLPPVVETPEESRPWFAMLRELRDSARARCGLALPRLSMGMSSDFEAAIEEGATLLRIGTDIFGPRG